MLLKVSDHSLFFPKLPLVQVMPVFKGEHVLTWQRFSKPRVFTVSFKNCRYIWKAACLHIFWCDVMFSKF